MEVNALRKVPPFKYTVEEDRKRWISLLYPLSPMFLQLVKDIDWTRLGLTYQLFGGTAYELYNTEYHELTKSNGFDLHTYADPTADIDVSVFYDPAKITRKEVNKTLFNEIKTKVANIQYYLKKHLVGEVSVPQTFADLEYYNHRANMPVGRYEVVDPVFIVLANVSQDESRIRINVQMGKFIDHIMEFIIYKTTDAIVPSTLLYGFNVRDILYELYSNIGTIIDMRTRTDAKIKVYNHINRFIYGYQLFDLLVLHNLYAQSNYSYIKFVYSKLFFYLVNIEDSAFQINELLTPYFEPFLAVLYSCPRSPKFLSHIIKTVNDLKADMVQKMPTANTEIYDTFLAKFNKCTTAGGRRIKKRRKSQQNKKQRKTRKRST